ncbi:hypothetical protein B0H67DRAFT_140536 [Lasiosphaeris hirsuta]|uniref:Secreted protein n=1 Tax=Lasiosphaeris hirsuta TaxID=260670 RepID=A0AA40E3J9_9PEZI|nr:hypothetical protein B0H67DRAFT_140536 [Lasiosphaeris hirsuta]
MSLALLFSASLSADIGVATLAGVPGSSVSSITKAASNTVGSGLEAAPLVVSSLSFLAARARRAGDWVPVPLDDRERRAGAEPEGCSCLLGSCLVCSSAIWRSIAPFSLCIVLRLVRSYGKRRRERAGFFTWNMSIVTGKGY